MNYEQEIQDNLLAIEKSCHSINVMLKDINDYNDKIKENLERLKDNAGL